MDRPILSSGGTVFRPTEARSDWTRRETVPEVRHRMCDHLKLSGASPRQDCVRRRSGKLRMATDQLEVERRKDTQWWEREECRPKRTPIPNGEEKAHCLLHRVPKHGKREFRRSGRLFYLPPAVWGACTMPG